MENTTWNIVGTSIIMEYAKRNIVGTSIVYEIQAFFRPAGGGGIKGQCTTVWATFWWNKIVMKGGINLNQYLSLALVWPLYSCSEKQFNTVMFFLRRLVVYLENCVEKYWIVFIFKIIVLKNTLLFSNGKFLSQKILYCIIIPKSCVKK